MIPALALTVRSLRADNRSPLQYALRAALVAMLVLAIGWAVRTSALLGAPGLGLFTNIVYLNFVFLSMLSISTFSRVITEEKDAGTLDLLKLAGFRPYSIVLGKSVGLLVATTLLVVVQVPFAMLAVTLGGVSIHQVFAAYAILVSYGVLLYGVGLVSSVICPGGLAAARLTAGVALALPLVPWVGGMFLVSLRTWGVVQAQDPTVDGLIGMLGALEEWSSLHALGGVLETGFDGEVMSAVVIANLAIGAVMLLQSWILFSRFARGDALWSLRGHRPSRVTRSLPRPVPRGRALAWKDFHFSAGGHLGVKVRLVAYGVVFALVGVLNYQPQLGFALWAFQWSQMTLSVMAVAMLVECGVQASRIFRDEIGQETLFGLALLPRRIHTWSGDKVRGGLGVVLVPLCYCGLATLMLVFAGAIDAGSPALAAVSFIGVPIIAAYVAAILIFVFYSVAYISLYVRHGAFPIAMAGIVFIYVLLGLMPNNFAFAGCSLLAFSPLWMLLAIIYLHIGIAKRLRTLASR